MKKFQSPYENELKAIIKAMLESGMSDEDILNVYLDNLLKILSKDKYSNTIPLKSDDNKY